jgi:DNA-binding MarR family transcriptional regulator
VAATDHRLIFLLTAGARRLQRFIETDLADSGLTAAQSGVLFHLGRHDGALIGDVAAALDIVPSAMTGLIDRMARAGLVERRADEGDGRASRVFLTPAGQALRRTAAQRAARLNDRLADGFTAAELDTVARWLGALQDRFPRP